MKNALQKEFLNWSASADPDAIEKFKPARSVRNILQLFKEGKSIGKLAVPAKMLVKYYDDIASELASPSPSTSMQPAMPKEEYFPEVLPPVSTALVEPQWSGKLAVLLPLGKVMTPFVAMTWLALMKDYSKDLWFNWRIGDMMIYNSRSWLMHDTFENHPECEWMLWLDDDIIAPFGRPTMYKDIIRKPNFPDALASVNVLNRLPSSGHKLIGGTYFTRNEAMNPVFDAKNPIVVEDALAATGRVHEVDWMGTGCMMVHRDVVAAIKESYQDLHPTGRNPDKNFVDYFRPIDGLGEDMAFCHRAKMVGHRAHLDTAVQCTHIGFKGYTPFGKV